MDRRLFTFGCSFTKYNWPTWADILSRDYDYFENWGQSGAGNQYIFNSLVECNQRNKFTADDTIVIMWTSIVREDRYCKNNWLTPGNIYSQNLYPKEFVDTFSDNRGYLIRDLATIQATKIMLDSLGVNYKFLSMIPIENVSEFAGTFTVKNDKDCLELYKDALDAIAPSIFSLVYKGQWENRIRYASKEAYYNAAGSDWPSFEKFLQKDFSYVPDDIIKELQQWAGPWGMNVYDSHPIPAVHMEYLEKVGYSISDSNRKWTMEINERLLNYNDYSHLWKPTKIKRL